MACNGHINISQCTAHTGTCSVHADLVGPRLIDWINYEVESGEIIDLEFEITQLIQELNTEVERGFTGYPLLPTVVSPVDSPEIRAIRDLYVSITGNPAVYPISDTEIDTGVIIKPLTIENMKDGLTAWANNCPCNCNYTCTCNCNYVCTCNCNHDCTCNIDCACHTQCTCNTEIPPCVGCHLYVADPPPELDCPCDCDYACTCDCDYACTCDCDYACTCDCNNNVCPCYCDYCTCDCDYACTCDCNYCTCDCNYCVCDCNYACTCDINCGCHTYCTCDCNHDCICDCNYTSTYSDEMLKRDIRSL